MDVIFFYLWGGRKELRSDQNAVVGRAESYNANGFKTSGEEGRITHVTNKATPPWVFFFLVCVLDVLLIGAHKTSGF